MNILEEALGGVTHGARIEWCNFGGHITIWIREMLKNIHYTVHSILY